eukprot:scaffold172094_cov31-Tisochrysis_lutea.AAC.2
MSSWTITAAPPSFLAPVVPVSRDARRTSMPRAAAWVLMAPSSSFSDARTYSPDHSDGLAEPQL